MIRRNEKIKCWDKKNKLIKILWVYIRLIQGWRWIKSIDDKYHLCPSGCEFSCAWVAIWCEYKKNYFVPYWIADGGLSNTRGDACV